MVGDIIKDISVMDNIIADTTVGFIITIRDIIKPIIMIVDTIKEIYITDNITAIAQSTIIINKGVGELNYYAQVVRSLIRFEAVS